MTPGFPGWPSSLKTTRSSRRSSCSLSRYAPFWVMARISRSATVSTTRTSFSSMQTMLLSNEAPRTMSRPARSMSAVASTTAGGLPGPAVMARLSDLSASRTTAGPPVTSRTRTPGCVIRARAVSIVGVRGGRHQVRRPAGADDRPVDEPNRLRRTTLRARVSVEDDRVAGRDDADRVVDDRRSRVGDRGDRRHDAERRELRDHHARVAGDGLDLEILGARRLGGDQAVLDDLVLDPAEVRLLVGHPRQLLGVIEHGATHGLDDDLPPGQALDLELLERSRGRGDGVIDRGVDAVAELGPAVAAVASSVSARRPSPGRASPAADTRRRTRSMISVISRSSSSLMMFARYLR